MKHVESLLHCILLDVCTLVTVYLPPLSATVKILIITKLHFTALC